MWKDMLVLMAAVAVVGCSDAPTEIGTATGQRALHTNPAFAATAGGQALYVAIPDVGAGLLPDEVLVATGHIGPVDFSECDGNSVTVARYAVLTGTGNQSYSKVHFSTNVEPGTTMSKFSFMTSCFIGGTQYQVYQVETQGPPLSPTPAGHVLYVAIPDVGAALPQDIVLVATGRTGLVDFHECDGNLFTAAPYGPLTGTGVQGVYGKVHFSTDVGPGTRMSKFSNRTSCLFGGSQYQVFDVETQ